MGPPGGARAREGGATRALGGLGAAGTDRRGPGRAPRPRRFRRKTISADPTTTPPRRPGTRRRSTSRPPPGPPEGVEGEPARDPPGPQRAEQEAPKERNPPHRPGSNGRRGGERPMEPGPSHPFTRILPCSAAALSAPRHRHPAHVRPGSPRMRPRGAAAVAPASAAPQQRDRDPEEVFARLKQRFDKNFDGVISAEGGRGTSGTSGGSTRTATGRSPWRT